MQTPTPQTSFFDAFKAPVWVIMMALQMVLGLALIIALIMKYYMLVFGTQVCTADDAGIANMVRCTPVMMMSAHFLMAFAGLRFAAFFFHDRPSAVLTPLMIGLAGIVLKFVEGVGIADASWSLAATLLALLVVASAVFYGRMVMSAAQNVDHP